MKHTAEVKWEVSKAVPGAIVEASYPLDNLLGLDAEGYAIFMDAKHAHLAVHCVNQHDRLVDALRKALVFCEAEQEGREASCLPEPTKDEEPYLEEASEIVDLLRAALAAEDAYESEVQRGGGN